MDPVLAKYATQPVPRYTSYPTAPHFSNAVQGEAYGRFLEALDPEAPVSLYLHLPFCRQLCWYCGCNMKLASRYEPVAAYVEDLLAEIELVASRLPSRLTVSHLAWGGGTPTALEPDDLERIMDAVRERFDFAEGAELAIESDPRTLTPAMTRRIGALGFTRASFGVQEFDPAVQAAINRIQPPDMVRACVDALREVGLSGINFDLIYGLPKQMVATLLRTIDLCAEMRPDRLALFGYAHVPWMAKKQRLIREDDLADGPGRLAQAEAAAAALADRGYQAIGLDHFALETDELSLAHRAGTLRRNFQGYTTDEAETLIGLGATAIGRTPSGHVQNIAETGAWARAVRSGVLPIARGHAFAGEDRLRADVIEALMCRGSVDLPDMARAHGAAAGWALSALAELAPMIDDGFVRYDGTTLALTEAGQPVMRVAAAAFDAYRSAAPARHSVAV